MTTQETPKLLWTRREAAAALGISERSLFDLTKDTDIPRVRLSERAIRYPVEQLKNWIEQHQTPAAV